MGLGLEHARLHHLAPAGLRHFEGLVAVAIEVYDLADGMPGRRPVPPHRPAQRHHGTGGDAPRQVEGPARQPGAPQRQRDQRRAETSGPGRSRRFCTEG
jgi:hypothetical protein